MVNKQDVSDGTGPNNNVGLLGDYLKQNRLDKNFSLEKLSQKTKISVNILKAIEANDYDKMPSAAYIKGFVSSYVKVLGLPLPEAINKMEYTYLNVHGKPFPALNHTKLMSTSGGPVKSAARDVDQNAHDVIEGGDSVLDNTKSMLPIIIFAAVVLLFIGGYKIISTVIQSEVSSDKAKDLGPKIENSSALMKKTETAKTVAVAAPAAATDTAVTAAPAAATAARADQNAEEVAKPGPAFQRNFPTMEFKPVKGKLYTIQRDAKENSDITILPEKIKSSMNSDLQNVYIRAVEGNTWLSYKIDNKPIESAIIDKGNDLLLQGAQIRIFLGNVNVTKIFYNNYLLETPNKAGVKTLIFPEDDNDKYLMPLFPKAKDDILYTAEDYIKRMKMEEDELAKKQ